MNESLISDLVLTDHIRLRYEALMEEYRPEQPPLSIIMGEIGLAFVEDFDNMTEARLKRFFDSVEKMIVRDDAVADAVATGLLEAIVAKADTEEIEIECLLPYIGSKSRAYISAWDDFCGTATDGVSE